MLPEMNTACLTGNALGMNEERRTFCHEAKSLYGVPKNMFGVSNRRGRRESSALCQRSPV